MYSKKKNFQERLKINLKYNNDGIISFCAYVNSFQLIDIRRFIRENMRFKIAFDFQRHLLQWCRLSYTNNIELNSK